mmetsp:Transcript_18391/g.61547  ORF Transcript_18391/g.61547 Transcript_18391/m.61547 type:complete len:240 (+) Transcript_18391:228-947(+)
MDRQPSRTARSGNASYCRSTGLPIRGRDQTPTHTTAISRWLAKMSQPSPSHCAQRPFWATDVERHCADWSRSVSTPGMILMVVDPRPIAEPRGSAPRPRTSAYAPPVASTVTKGDTTGPRPGSSERSAGSRASQNSSAARSSPAFTRKEAQRRRRRTRVHVRGRWSADSAGWGARPEPLPGATAASIATAPGPWAARLRRLSMADFPCPPRRNSAGLSTYPRPRAKSPRLAICGPSLVW